MRRGPGVVAAGEDGGEALVEELDRLVDRGAKLHDELVRLGGLRAALAAQRQRKPDDDLLRLLRADHGEQLVESPLLRHARHGTDRPRDDAGGIGHGDARPRGPVVERQDLQETAARSLSRPVVRASRTPSTFFPPASASVDRPPPPPPMIGPSSRTSFTASKSASDLSRLITSATFPSSADATTTPFAFSRRRSWSERSRSAPPRAPFTSATKTSPCLSCQTTSGPSAAASAFGFFASRRAWSSCARTSSSSRERPCRTDHASPAVTA